MTVSFRNYQVDLTSDAEYYSEYYESTNSFAQELALQVKNATNTLHDQAILDIKVTNEGSYFNDDAVFTDRYVKITVKDDETLNVWEVFTS